MTTRNAIPFKASKGSARGVAISMAGGRAKSAGPKTTITSRCKHRLDSTFPKESVGSFLVGRCYFCECIVAVEQVA